MSNASHKVGKSESQYRYNPDWGGSHPVLWLPAGWRPNKNNMQAFDLSPWCRKPGTWAGTTAQRNVVTDRGRAWTFANANSDYCNLGQDSRWMGEMSVAFWFRANGDYTTAQAICAYADSLSQARFAVTFSYNNGKMEWWNTWGGPDLSSAAIADDLYRHYVFTRAGSAGAWTLTLYVNGLLAATVVEATNNPMEVDPDAHLAMGRFGAFATGYYLKGKLRDLALWDSYVLNAVQARLLYESSLDGSPGVQARPIGPRWFPAAVAGGVELVVQDSECIVESESPALTQHHTLAVAGSVSIVESGTVALTQHHALTVGDSESLVTSESLALTQHQALTVQDSESPVESENVGLTQHHVLTVADTESLVESDNVTLTAHEAEFVVQDSESLVTSESPSLTQHHVFVVADAECLVVSEEPTLLLRELLVLADLVCLVVSESPVLTLHYTSPSVIRRGPSAEDTQLRRGPSSAGQPLRRGPGSTDGTIRRPNES